MANPDVKTVIATFASEAFATLSRQFIHSSAVRVQTWGKAVALYSYGEIIAVRYDDHRVWITQKRLTTPDGRPSRTSMRHVSLVASAVHRSHRGYDLLYSTEPPADVEAFDARMVKSILDGPKASEVPPLVKKQQERKKAARKGGRS